MITDLEPGKRNGWLPRSVWSFLKQPKAAESKLGR